MKSLKSCSTRFMCGYGSLLLLSSFLFCLDFWLPEELVDFLDGFGEGEDGHSVVGLDVGVSDCDE